MRGKPWVIGSGKPNDRGPLQVLLDCGGKEGPVDPRLLAALAVLTPNETELARLTGRLPSSPSFHEHCYSQALS